MPPVLRVTVSLVLAAISVGVTASSQQQQPAPQPSVPATAFILGRTVDGTSGRPVEGVTVSLNSSTPPNPLAAPAPGANPATLSRYPLRVLSDGNGAFVFRSLPAGLYTVTGTKPGYTFGGIGRDSAAASGTQVIVLGEGERRGGATMKMWKQSSISGTVLDEAGEPLVGVQLRDFRRAVVGGRPRYMSAGNMPTTDDRGVYRMMIALPGDYIVGIVMTQATVPTSLQDVFGAAQKGGGGEDFRRELDRSSATLSSSPFGAGQRVGAWLLQSTSSSELSSRASPGLPVSGDRVFVYPATYYPASPTLATATVLTIASGEDRTGVDFRLKPVVTSRVSGRLVGPGGDEGFTALSLMPVGTQEVQRDSDMAAATTVADNTGAFTFLGVTPGEYVIRVLKAPPRPVPTSSMSTVIQTGSTTIMSGGGPSVPTPIGNDPTFWAATPVTVSDRDLSGVVVTLQTGTRITGKLEFDGTAARPPTDRLLLVSVQVDRADASQASFTQFALVRGVVDASGQFRTHQLPAGRYVLRASGGLPGWTFKSATLGGRDLSDAPFELTGEDMAGVVVTFTDRLTELSGAARDAKGPDSTATVFVFPGDTKLWTDHGPAPRRFRSARVGSDGSYRIPSLPAGEYLVAALRAGATSDWIDPRFLQTVAPLATRITLMDGEKKSLDVEVREVRR
jgi:hypothetical protein